MGRAGLSSADRRAFHAGMNALGFTVVYARIVYHAFTGAPESSLRGDVPVPVNQTETR